MVYVNFSSYKPKILFVSQTLGYKVACGIGLIGDLFGRGLLEHPKYNVELFYSDDINEVKQKIRSSQPAAVLYNYNPGTTPWVDDISLRQGEFEHIPQARVMHDIDQKFVDSYRPENNFNWKFNFSSDSVLKGNKYIFPTARLIPPPPTKNYQEKEIPFIGFHGFGFPDKGIPRIAHQVVKEFNEAVIRLHIPFSYFADPYGHHAKARVEEVKQIVSIKPGIHVIATHDMLDISSIIEILGQNTVNCYFYDFNEGRALSSSVDYAISARRPIASTRSHQMRNVWNLKPTVLIEETTLREIINNDIYPLQPLYESYTKEKFWDDYDKGLQILLNLN